MGVPGQIRFAPTAGSWTVAKDGDLAGMELFRRHYTFKAYRDGRKRTLFCGPGYKMVLITPGLDALFVWRKFKDDSGQQGINCAVFRNESDRLASELILEAEAFAWRRWPSETRLYTYVNDRKIRSRNPGYCFIRAGWKRCGITKWNRLLIFEKQREVA